MMYAVCVFDGPNENLVEVTRLLVGASCEEEGKEAAEEIAEQLVAGRVVSVQVWTYHPDGRPGFTSSELGTFIRAYDNTERQAWLARMGPRE